jgi:hypothetical protein
MYTAGRVTKNGAGSKHSQEEAFAGVELAELCPPQGRTTGSCRSSAIDDVIAVKRWVGTARRTFGDRPSLRAS